MSIPLSERTVELQFTDEYDDNLDDRIASLLVEIVSRISVEEIKNITNDIITQQNT